MKYSKENLIKKINNRPIVIWGARMTGIGLLRFAKNHALNVVGFVDRDPSLIGRKIDKFQINKPDIIPSLKAKHHNLAVVVAVLIELLSQESLD